MDVDLWFHRSHNLSQRAWFRLTRALFRVSEKTDGRSCVCHNEKKQNDEFPSTSVPIYVEDKFTGLRDFDLNAAVQSFYNCNSELDE